MKLYDELKARGLIAQVTNEEEISEMINNGKATFYIGFDPTADSLHVGHFMALCLMKRLRHRAADYTTADLESPLAELHFDVLRIPLPDASYDVLICNHLLEHVADDRRALGEFYRILRPGGWGILLSPVDRSRAATFEDDSITDPEERTRIFGQYDHRRIYGRDYGGRLREAGFEVREIDYAARFSAEERRRYALPDDWIYVVRRPL